MPFCRELFSKETLQPINSLIFRDRSAVVRVRYVEKLQEIGKIAHSRPELFYRRAIEGDAGYFLHAAQAQQTLLEREFPYRVEEVQRNRQTSATQNLNRR